MDNFYVEPRNNHNKFVYIFLIVVSVLLVLYLLDSAAFFTGKSVSDISEKDSKFFQEPSYAVESAEIIVSEEEACSINVNFTSGLVNSACRDKNDCLNNLTCGSNNFCGVEVDGSCKENSECQSNICGAGNFCLNDIGGYCEYGTDCNSNYCDTVNSVCSNGALGNSCKFIDDCESGICLNYVCS